MRKKIDCGQSIANGQTGRVRQKTFNLFLLGLATAFIGIPTAGQTYQTFKTEQEQILLRARWRIGPLRILPIFQLRNVGYDNNVYSQPRNTDPVPDYTASAGIQLNAHLLYRNWVILSLMEYPEYVFFFKEKRERSWNNGFSPSLKLLLFNRFALSGKYQFRKERRRASSEFDVQADEKRKAYSGAFFHETSRHTALGLSGSVETIAYEDITQPGADISLARSLNRTERNASVEAYYRIFSSSQFFLSGGRTEYDFEHMDSRWRDSYSTQLYSGIRFPEIGPIRGAFSLGFKKFVPRTRERKGFTGLVGNTDFAIRVGRFAARARYVRDCVFSYDSRNIYFLEDRWNLGLSVYVNNFLRLDYDFTPGRAAYPEAIPVIGPDGQSNNVLRKDISTGHSAGLVFRVVRSTGIGLVFNSWKRESNFYADQRNRWFLGGYLTFEF